MPITLDIFLGSTLNPTAKSLIKIRESEKAEFTPGSWMLEVYLSTSDGEIASFREDVAFLEKVGESNLLSLDIDFVA